MAFRDSTAMQLRRAYMTIHRYAQAHFAQFGVTADQYVLLSVLAEEDGVTQRELTNAISSDANTIGAMLRLLEEKGLVTRRQDRADARARIVQLSAKGRKLQKELVSSAEAIHGAMAAAVGANDWEQLGSTLRKIEGAIWEISERAAAAG